MINEQIKNKALEYAIFKHNGQKRKYTGEDYIIHPIEVSSKILEYMDKNLFSEKDHEIMYCSAILHDTVEDTDATLEEIESLFGKEIALNIFWLTNISKPEDGNRKIRKQKDLEHILSAPLSVICIKIADVICNCKGMVETDRKYSNGEFCKKYIPEKIDFYKRLIEKDISKEDHKFKILFSNIINELKEVLEKEKELIS